MNINITASGMSCQHCIAAVTHAIQDIDKTAQVTVDLTHQTIQINNVTAAVDALKAAITEEGFDIIQCTTSL